MERIITTTALLASYATIVIVVLMIGAPTVVMANKADTEQESGVATDAQGRICDFGPNHDECPNASNTMPPGSKADSGDDVSGFPKPPPGKHYAGCEEDINHELGCDVINDTSSP
jgi:hypothetical protein